MRVRTAAISYLWYFINYEAISKSFRTESITK